ncbi:MULTISPECIES: arginine repressor [Streptococcus]|uniref:Arginine repressor n=1 Tax=Streptococcus sinensis TaxID=176090 RepID=A0A0A0DJA2_9STRE|nr:MULTISPECIES: arginine repressor [Streptococcus]KGM38110.1 arginine repressor [Streptococcus sinensis]KXT66789.1 arginine repressor [Streptococcus sp. DD04]
MKKKDRLEKIRRFVSEFEIGTQEEIVEHLRESGITATQATVSRDIKELGIVKIPFKDNTYIYELPKTATNSLKLAENNILACQNLGNMINLTLVPGSTAVVKRHLSKEFTEEIFSIIADNDSILVVAVSESAAKKVTAEIDNW